MAIRPGIPGARGENLSGGEGVRPGTANLERDRGPAARFSHSGGQICSLPRVDLGNPASLPIRRRPALVQIEEIMLKKG